MTMKKFLLAALLLIGPKLAPADTATFTRTATPVLTPTVGYYLQVQYLTTE
jgi:hypothetical protein